MITVMQMAQRVMRELNPDVKVKCFTDPVDTHLTKFRVDRICWQVGVNTEHIFNEQVWSSQDLLLNALNNEERAVAQSKIETANHGAAVSGY